MNKSEFIQRASLNAALAAIMERVDKLDERLRNVEDAVLLLVNDPNRSRNK